MTHFLFGFLFAFFTAAFVIIGDFAIKLAADGGKPVWSGFVLIGMLTYATSAILWFYAMRHVTLAQAGVIYAMLTLLALCVIGVIWFDERLYTREYLGIACACASMVLMARVS